MGEPTPRPFSIQKNYLINYKYTPSCLGCYAAANDRKYRPHTNEYRRLIEEAMPSDKIGDNRINAARERKNAWLEQQVHEGDNSKATATHTAASASPVEAPTDVCLSIVPGTIIYTIHKPQNYEEPDALKVEDDDDNDIGTTRLTTY